VIDKKERVDRKIDRVKIYIPKGRKEKVKMPAHVFEYYQRRDEEEVYMSGKFIHNAKHKF
jgi:hypothetical protein